MSGLRVLLNSYHSGANAWFALGEARGHFEREGLKVEFAPGAGAYRAPMVMVDQGFDLAFGDLPSMIALAAGMDQAAPAAVYVVHHTSPSAIAVVRDGPVHAPGDLVGRRIITHASDVAYRSFPAYARAAGIAADKVEITISEAPMAGMLQAMLAGEGDGVFGYVSSQNAVLRQIDPTLAERLRFLPFPQVVPDLYGSVIMATAAAMTQKRDDIRAFLRAVTASLMEAVAEPEAAVEAVIARNPALDAVVERQRWRGVIVDEIFHPEIQFSGFGEPDLARLTRSIDQLTETLPLSRAPGADRIFDAAFLPGPEERRSLAAAITQFAKP